MIMGELLDVDVVYRNSGKLDVNSRIWDKNELRD